jgi:hypothetical protein
MRKAMDPTDRQDGHAPPSGDRAKVRPSEVDARARLDRRAEALRANLKRRKAQSRSRAEAERTDPTD